jgi:hypothetical protein
VEPVGHAKGYKNATTRQASFPQEPEATTVVQSVEPKKIMATSRKKFFKINVLLTFLCYLFFPSQTPTHLGEAHNRCPYVVAKAST